VQFKLLAQFRQSFVFTQRCQATFALNSGLNTRRVRRPDDLIMMSSCPGTFAVAKNPNNALIWPVQFCRATSNIGGFKFEAQHARVIDETPLRVF
jgi:hypothetical protein